VLKFKNQIHLLLTLQERNNIRLSEKLFGPANQVYVSRDHQLTDLSNEIYSYFNTITIYHKMSLVWHLLKISISLTSEASFKHVSFEDALNISEDIKSDQIKNEMAKLFKIDKTANTSHIVFDNKYNDELLDNHSKSSGSGSGSVSAFKIFDGKGSRSYVNDHKEQK
jgi:hypothetical protein